MISDFLRDDPGSHSCFCKIVYSVQVSVVVRSTTGTRTVVPGTPTATTSIVPKVQLQA
jgi:hypothetical protein